MKKTYVSKRFRPESMRIIRMCDDILTEYTAAGYRMTLRQLYYKLVSANVIPNSDKSYKNVGALVSDARLAGLLDWDAVEDRVRVPTPSSSYWIWVAAPPVARRHTVWTRRLTLAMEKPPNS